MSPSKETESDAHSYPKQYTSGIKKNAAGYKCNAEQLKEVV